MKHFFTNSKIIFTVFSFVLFLLIIPAISNTDISVNSEKNVIKTVIEKAYIQGIHIKQNRNLADTGFHPDFTMLVLRNNKLIKIGLDQWFKMMGGSRDINDNKPGPKTTFSFKFVDITGPAATAKLIVYKNGKLFATDYMSLYKFKNKWKIVSKIFTFGSINFY